MVIGHRSKVIYLLLLSVGCFFIYSLPILAALFLLQIGLWVAYRLPLHDLLRTARRLSFFIVLILLSFAFFPSESLQSDVWTKVPVGGGMQVSVNLSGLIFGLLMSLRVLTIVLASLIVQMGGQSGDLVKGLRGIGLPTVVALTLDSTLHLLGPSQAGRGMGKGEGHGPARPAGREGRRREKEGDGKTESGLTFKRIIRGDFSFLIEMIERNLTRAQLHVREQKATSDPRLLHDVTVISGLCLLMMTTKLLKVLPGIPFAPGHKIVVLVPLYILAAELTHSRFGSTITGTSVGILSFLFGDGRFGVFEIFKHITPGLLVDAAVPLLRRWSARPSLIAYIILGALCALARITTILIVTLLIEAPAMFYALLVPMMLSQTVFGGISGFVTFYLMSSLGRLKAVAGMGQTDGFPDGASGAVPVAEENPPQAETEMLK